MLAFGLGTLPALLLVGFMADTVKSILKIATLNTQVPYFCCFTVYKLVTLQSNN